MNAREQEIVIALAGNPNVGKSTLFNTLTGIWQYTANWPGKTVDIKIGYLKYDGLRIRVVDLPGTYSLTAFSAEEAVAREFIVKEKPDVVVQVIDAPHVRRNLYLTLELLELTSNLVIALNMVDITEKHGVKIDAKRLSQVLGIPVIPTIATRRVGIEKLLKTCVTIAKGTLKLEPIKIQYPKHIEESILKLEKAIGVKVVKEYPARWIAIKLLEGDPEAEEILREAGIWDKVKGVLSEIKEKYPEISTEISLARCSLIDRIIKEAAIKSLQMRITEKIDSVVLNRIAALPILFGTYFIAFFAAFTLAKPVSDYIGDLFDYLASVINMWLVSVNTPSIIRSLIVDAVLPGISTVASFLPLIVAFFIVYGFMEDVGYLARTAVIMDKVMRVVGLHGRAFLCLVLSFGCNVLGVMCTRTLEEERDRIVTTLALPFVPCGARLAVMMIIVSFFFEGLEAALVMLFLVALSLFLAVLSAKIFHKLLSKQRTLGIAIELPDYKMPSVRNILILTWVRTKEFIKRAGTIIMLGVIVTWAICVLPTFDIESSYGAMLAKSVEPLGALIGMDWRRILSLFLGFIAKEATLASLAVIYGLEEEAKLKTILSAAWTPWDALTYLVVVMTYMPCVATFATIKMETKSWKIALLSLFYSIAVSFALGVIFHTLSLLLVQIRI